jgi:hypothetical protein
MRVELTCVMRVDSGRRKQHARLLLGQRARLHAARHRRACDDEAGDAGCGGARKHLAAVVIEAVVRKVRPDVDQFVHFGPDCDDARRTGQRCPLNWRPCA